MPSKSYTKDILRTLLVPQDTPEDFETFPIYEGDILGYTPFMKNISHNSHDHWQPNTNFYVWMVEFNSPLRCKTTVFTRAARDHMSLYLRELYPQYNKAYPLCSWARVLPYAFGTLSKLHHIEPHEEHTIDQFRHDWLPTFEIMETLR